MGPHGAAERARRQCSAQRRARLGIRSLNAPVDRAGRVRVEPDLSLPGHPEVFVVGDAAHLEIDGEIVPGLAPAAIQEGRAAADNVAARVAGRPTRAFRYRDKGIMATIGKRRALVKAGRFELTGVLAWLMWLVVHTQSLTGFRNRVSVFRDWGWSYIFSRRGARLITNADWRLDVEPTPGSSDPESSG